jgi:hypothetical protein
MSAAARSLFLAQVGFLLALAVCVLMDSRGLHDNHGWSYYEEHGRTFLPYVLGFAWLIFWIWQASGLLTRSSAPAALAPALKLLAIFFLLDVATPDTVNTAFSWAHNLSSTLLFLYELGFAIWLVIVVWQTWTSRALLLVQFLGGLIAMFSFVVELISQLGLGILLFQLSFGALLVASTAHFRELAPEPSRSDDVAMERA